MTIKQLGGVFGRNPTFNDVTIEGTLTLEDMTSTGIDVVGPELVTNGTFDDATGWSGVAETTDNRWYVDNGQLTKGSINGTAEQISNPFVAGKSYVVQFDVVAIPNGNVFVAIGDDTHQITGGAGTKSVFLTPTSVSSSLRFYTGGAGGGGVIIDNLSVKQIALIANLDDGVIVPGTVTADGLDVVGPEQVTNGTFDTDLSGWIATGTGTATWVSGQAELSEAVNFRQDSITTDSGAFLISWDQTITAGTRTRVRIRNAAGSQDVGPFLYYTSSGSNSVVVATTTGISLQFITEAGNTALIDNVSVKQIALIANLDDGVIVDNLQVEGVLSGDPTLQFNIGTSEAMRIDSSGNLLVGKTASDVGATEGFEWYDTADVLTLTRDAGHALSVNRLNSPGDVVTFRKDGTTVGSISVTASATAYNTSSDQRLKENIVDAPSASDDIDAIQVRSFDWKADGSHQKYGMVAQELVTVAPEAVSAPEDPEEMMSVDYSKLVPMLIKEVQQLRARVAQLEGAN